MEYIGNLKVLSSFKTVTFSIEPTAEQFSSFVHRITPDIKTFFNDEQVQKEFAEWQEKPDSA